MALSDPEAGRLAVQELRARYAAPTVITPEGMQFSEEAKRAVALLDRYDALEAFADKLRAIRSRIPWMKTERTMPETVIAEELEKLDGIRDTGVGPFGDSGPR